MSSRRNPFRTIVYLLIVLSLLGQSVSSLLISPAQARGMEAGHGPAQVGEEARPAWERPESEGVTFRALTPPEPLTMPEMPPPFTASDTLHAPPPVPFPFGNNNLGEYYKDSNNFEDHPGRAFAGPVNLINGNLFLTAGDHFFPATGVSVQFARSYNHLEAAVPGPLGNGWTHSYNTRVVQENPGVQVVIQNGDGTLHEYTSGDGGITWDSPPGVFRELFHPPGPLTPYMVIHKNGLVEDLNPNGQLQAIVDRNGNTVQMQYDGFNRLSNVIASDGRELLITYDGLNRINMVQDPIGRQTIYTYDGNNNLVTVNYPEGSEATYVYDGLNRIISFTDPRQPRGARSVTDVQYDGSDRADYVELGATTAYTMIYGGSGTDWVDSAGQIQRILFDANFNVVFDGAFFSDCVCFQGETYTYFPNLLLQQKADALTNTTVYDYDGNGNLITVISPGGAKTDFDYEFVFNNVISTTNPSGNQTFYEYDSSGNLTAEIAPLGRMITYTYDSAGNLLAQMAPDGSLTQYSYDPAGNLLTLTPPDVGATTFVYDTIGRVTQKIDPNGGVTTYDYDASDRLLLVTDPISGTIGYEYDANDNLVRLTDQNSQVISYTYDALDRVLSATDPLGESATYTYDPVGRLSVRTDSMGATTTYAYDEASRLTQRSYSDGIVENYVYDPAGRVVIVTDNTNYSLNMGYDSEGRPITYVYNSLGFSSPTTVTITYDPAGNRDSVKVDDGTTDFVTTYEYDNLYRMVRTTGDDGRQWDTTYDSLDRRLTLTEPDNSHVEYDYSSRGNLLELRHYDPGNVLEETFTYTYDDLNNTLSETENGQTTTYAYDLLSRMIQATNPAGTADYTYDGVGNRLTFDGPDGINTFTYDIANHLLSSNDTTYTYDPMGRRISDVGPAGNRIYTYDGEMRLTTFTNDAVNATLGYDGMGNLVRKEVGSEITHILNSDRGVEAELDAVGDIKTHFTVDVEIVSMELVSAGPIQVDLHWDGRNRVRWATDALTGDLLAEYSANPAEDHDTLYNPIRMGGVYYIPEIGLYHFGDGQYWDPWSGLLLTRYWPWAFWVYGPYSPWYPIFRYWPWPWPWARPWGWAWPRPWPFVWPWAGIWVRPWIVWPMWPWTFFPLLPWWWWSSWWGWGIWYHWWWWYDWWWYDGWWGWGWWYWGWWGWSWWLWGWWWWPWYWWWPCWWGWGWWIWWWWWFWWGWGWWWWWDWGWWWWWYWPYYPRPPDYGDAPDPSFPSLLASDGARHLNPGLEWLGPSVDREYDANVTDLDLFDDGVLVDLSTGTATFIVNTSGGLWRYGPTAPVHVHGWIDWNDDGDWADGGEMVVNWSGYPGDGTWPAGATSVSVSVPIAVPSGPALQVWARFRLDYNQNIETVTGWANYGEVEDYLLYTQPNLPTWNGTVNVSLTDALTVLYPTDMVTNTVSPSFSPNVTGVSLVWSSSPLLQAETLSIEHDPFMPFTTYTLTLSAGQTEDGHWLLPATYTFTTGSDSYEIYMPIVLRP